MMPEIDPINTWEGISLPGDPEIDDYIWSVYDYLWIKADQKIYLSRDCGENFVEVGVIRFALVNVWHILRQLYRRWLLWSR